MIGSFVLPVDKPVGPTSHDVVAMARRALGTRRVGHTGTLDPFASGLLLLCVNHATRLAEYLGDLPKSYRAIARFDGATTTDDCTGDYITTSDAWLRLGAERVREAFETQRGTIAQRPSRFSAKKVDGERAYDLARRGEAVDLSPADVTIYDIRVVTVELPDVTFEVDCSSGTYVRAIARDVGELLGTGGHLTGLRRTRIGPLSVEIAAQPDALAEAPRLSMIAAIPHVPRIDVTADEERALRFGQAIARASAAGEVALVRNGGLIGMGRADGERVKPRKVFPVE